MPRGVIWIGGILALSLFLGGGLWVWMTRLSDDRAPQFQSVSVHPPLLRFVGGLVTVTAVVIDDSGVARVSGSAMRGDSEYHQLPAKNISANSTEVAYSTEFPALPNVRNDGVAMDYLVRLVAVDSAGQETIGEVTFQVAAPSAPPAPPSAIFSP